jgi:hypothetical protein
MNPPGERRFPRLPLAKADAGASPDLLDIIKQEGCV